MTSTAGVSDAELITRVPNAEGAARRERFDRPVEHVTAVCRRRLRGSVRRPLAELTPRQSIEIETKGGQRDRR